MSAEEFRRLIDVSRGTVERLEHYARLLSRWNRAINLVSKATEDQVWTRHFLDSAQLIQHTGRTDRWADFGTGAGFPGLVVAVLALEKTPETKFYLFESDARKCAFLATVCRELSLNAEVLATRVEIAEPAQAGVVSARALARLALLLDFAQRHLDQTGRALFLKGARYEDEIEEARKVWNFDLKTHKSLTDPSGAILNIGAISRV